ncbi:MAG: type III-A CRISPR-associated RAMP protein Csm4 [Caldisericales bacterium]|nr:type III-A CRISPR-associated RAMP protein Csm4 [Caldisericales bacterium]
MQWEIYHIDGRSFHFGKQGMGIEESDFIFSSDSLFSALTACAFSVAGTEKTNAWLAPFQANQPPLVLTSAFPRAGNVRFFPTPMCHFPKNGLQDAAVSLKNVKKISLVSEKIFRRILKGESLWTLVGQSGVKILNQKVLISAEEVSELPQAVLKNDSIWKQEKRPRVTLNRETNASTLFFSGQTQFFDGCGLWFGVQRLSANKDFDDLFSAALETLAENGLGGERNAGFGQCQIGKQDLALELPDPAGSSWMTLSRYIPAADEMIGLMAGCSAYMIDPVGGWLYSPGNAAQRRRTVRMIREGAVLGTTSKRLNGLLVDVQPDYDGSQPIGHAVWRNGFAAAVGVPAWNQEM